MITEIRNKITTIGETVTGNFFYQLAPADQSFPYCVYTFFANNLQNDTKNDGQEIYFQVSCYQRTDGLVETLADSIETAFETASNWNAGTTSYNIFELKKIRRVPFPPEVEDKSKRLIIEFYLWIEEK